MHRRLVTAVGVVAALVCAWFVGRRLADGWDELTTPSAGWLAAALVLAAAAMLVIASGWWALLRHGVAGRWSTVATWFFAGEIGKYVPGTVWPIVGRAELAVRGGVPRRDAYRSVFLSLGLLYLAASFLAASLRPWTYLPLVVATAIAARFVPVTVALRYLPAWVLVGGATWTIARSLDPHAPFLGVAAAAAGSWLVGFLAVPVPGGVGVREAAFVALAPAMAPGVAATTAVAARLAFVAVDSVAAVIAWHRLRRQ